MEFVNVTLLMLIMMIMVQAPAQECSPCLEPPQIGNGGIKQGECLHLNNEVCREVGNMKEQDAEHLISNIIWAVGKVSEVGFCVSSDAKAKACPRWVDNGVLQPTSSPTPSAATALQPKFVALLWLMALFMLFV